MTSIEWNCHTSVVVFADEADAIVAVCFPDVMLIVCCSVESAARETASIVWRRLSDCRGGRTVRTGSVIQHLLAFGLTLTLTFARIVVTVVAAGRFDFADVVHVAAVSFQIHIWSNVIEIHVNPNNYCATEIALHHRSRKHHSATS